MDKHWTKNQKIQKKFGTVKPYFTTRPDKFPLVGIHPDEDLFSWLGDAMFEEAARYACSVLGKGRDVAWTTFNHTSGCAQASYVQGFAPWILSYYGVAGQSEHKIADAFERAYKSFADLRTAYWNAAGFNGSAPEFRRPDVPNAEPVFLAHVSASGEMITTSSQGWCWKVLFTQEPKVPEGMSAPGYINGQQLRSIIHVEGNDLAWSKKFNISKTGETDEVKPIYHVTVNTFGVGKSVQEVLQLLVPGALLGASVRKPKTIETWRALVHAAKQRSADANIPAHREAWEQMRVRCSYEAIARDEEFVELFTSAFNILKTKFEVKPFPYVNQKGISVQVNREIKPVEVKIPTAHVSRIERSRRRAFVWRSTKSIAPRQDKPARVSTYIPVSQPAKGAVHGAKLSHTERVVIASDHKVPGGRGSSKSAWQYRTVELAHGLVTPTYEEVSIGSSQGPAPTITVENGQSFSTAFITRCRRQPKVYRVPPKATQVTSINAKSGKTSFARKIRSDNRTEAEKLASSRISAAKKAGNTRLAARIAARMYEQGIFKPKGTSK